MNDIRGKRRSGLRRTRAVIAASVVAVASGNALAFEFDTGNPDLSIRWDNTFRYNLGMRVEGRDNNIGNSAVSDEGTYSFNTGDLVTNRLDILSELDVVYKKWIGFRLSGAGWWDAAYDANSHSNPNPPLVNIPSYPNLQYTNYTKRYYRGPSGELLDAFGFANFDLGTVPTSLKAGRLSLYWGESLFVGGNLHGIAYSQNPLDLQKGFATPGSEAKELFRPLGQVTGQAQVTDTVSVAAQYFWQWEEFRYPEGGTYTGPVDFVFNGPVRQFLSVPLGFATRGNAFEPGQSGEWGLSARWSPQWLDGTLGFYYRNFADKLPQTLLTRVGANRSVYNLIYKDDVDLWGISLAKNIAGVSVGAELSYRVNTPLNAQVLGNAAAAGTPARGSTPGPVGDTYHGLVNLVGLIPKTPVFDTAAYALELTWSQWAKVKSGQNLFNAVGFQGCSTLAGQPLNKWDGCTTKNFFGLALAFTPTWFQVFPGVDLSAPLTFATGLKGNAATVFGGNEANGNYTIGIGADIFQKYRVDLKYIDWFGRYKTGPGPNGQQVTSQNGLTTLLEDRGFISLTLKATF